MWEEEGFRVLDRLKRVLKISVQEELDLYRGRLDDVNKRLDEL
jgi:hypothetical protein